MHACSNCSIETETPLVVSQNGVTVAALCDHCTNGTKLIKLVMARGADGIFECMQYAPLEMMQKAFGK